MINPVYLIAQIDVKDQQCYMEDYGSKCLRQFARLRGQSPFIGQTPPHTEKPLWLKLLSPRILTSR